MDSPQSANPSLKRRIRIGVIAIAFALVTLVVVGILSARKKPALEPTLVWLDPVQFASQMHPGRLTRLYYQALNLTAPLFKHFKSSKKQILIDASIFAARETSMDELHIGVPVATNGTGARLWILSASELHGLRNQIQASKGVNLVNRPRMTLGEGTWASMCMGQAAQGTAFIGVSLDMSPKIVSHQFQIGMNAVYTEPGDAAAIVRTNLSATCRVIMPNAGGILITGPDSSQLNGTNYWLILSPTAIDGSGKAINL
jgi:hypothetical protein